MKKTKFSFLLILTALFSFQLIKSYQLRIPNYFPIPVYNFKKNPLDSNKIYLGRLLFYDGILSKNKSISCSTCHSPFNAFSHTDHSLSHGIDDKIGTRNTSALFNLAWQPTFMWDGAINHLDMQALAPINSETEMGFNIEEAIHRLNTDRFYKTKFFNIYNDSIITGEKFLKVLAQFQLSLISSNSKYDKVKERKENFTDSELKGYKIFKRNCNACHQEPLFSTYEFENNYLPLDSVLKDYGRGSTTLKKSDSLKFKIPSLRNLSYSFPYMHDGRFFTLKKVINHYNREETRKSIQKEKKIRLRRMSSKDQVNLINFLLTLDDKEFVYNSVHGFPRELLSKWNLENKNRSVKEKD